MKKHRRYFQEHAVKNGWSRWVTPVMRKYLLVCCDCDLVHEIEFTAIKVRSNWTRGRFVADRLPLKKYRVEFRVRRRNGLTRALRKR